MLLVASRHPWVAAALHESLGLLVPQNDLIHRVDRYSFSCAEELFEWLDHYPPEQLRDLMVLFDIGSETAQAWDVKMMRGESGLAAQLVLSYPEVYFLFIGASDNTREPQGIQNVACWPIIKSHHFASPDCLINTINLIELHAQGFRTIFDATGLRSFLKLQLQAKVLGQSLSDREWIYMPFSKSRLNSTAAVADEEAAFLYLNGYAAFRFGFRAWIAPTQAEFTRLLGDPRPVERFAVALLDWHLTYRDSKFEGGGTPNPPQPLPLRLHALDPQKVDQPIIVTSFPDEVDISLHNRAIVVSKPYGGLFQLVQVKPNRVRNPFQSKFWRRVNQLNETFNEVMDETVQLSKKAPTTPAPSSSRCFPAHRAPFACSLIANRLLARARYLVKDGNTETEAWVQIALLAAETKEILGGLSRTTAYEAVALQNAAEVHAEVSFFGTSAQMAVGQRLDVLEDEARIVERAGRSTAQRPQRADRVARLNCQLQTVNNLRLRFAEHEQIQAAEICLISFAKYDRKLKYSSWRSLLLFPLLWAERYADFVTRAGTSVWRLLGCSADYRGLLLDLLPALGAASKARRRPGPPCQSQRVAFLVHIRAPTCHCRLR